MSGRSIVGYEKVVLSCLGMDLSDNVAQFCAPPAKSAYAQAQKCPIFRLEDKHTFMQNFALTAFKTQCKPLKT